MSFVIKPPTISPQVIMLGLFIARTDSVAAYGPPDVGVGVDATMVAVSTAAAVVALITSPGAFDASSAVGVGS